MDGAGRRQASCLCYPPEVKRRPPVRIIALAVIVLAHGVVFYIVMNERAKSPVRADDRQAFTPAERETGGSSGSLSEGQRGDGAVSVARADLRWRFDPIEVLPTAVSENAVIQGRSSDESDQSRITLTAWTLPEYPREWARAGEEGALSFDIHLDTEGRPTETKLLRATASSHLVESARVAVTGWRFSMPPQKTGWAEVELRFSAYRFGYSLVVPEPLPDEGAGPGKQPVDSQQSFRELLRDLSSSKPTFANLENTQPDYQKMRTTVLKWGRAVEVRSLGPQNNEWKDYATTPAMRGTTRGGTIALRWDLYDVRHKRVRAKWKVAVDPWDRIWAAKADPY